jgi:predicted nucleic acid-binding protein
MTTMVVSDSTPFIGLARIGQFDVLRELFGKIVVPKAVYEEVVEQGSGRPGAEELRSADWVETREVSGRDGVEVLKLSVDAGEAEAIALAMEVSADLLLVDDPQGRRIAKGLGIPVSGTVGVLLRFFRGDPSGFKGALDALLAEGFRLGPDEYERVLKLSAAQGK